MIALAIVAGGCEIDSKPPKRESVTEFMNEQRSEHPFDVSAGKRALRIHNRGASDLENLRVIINEEFTCDSVRRLATGRSTVVPFARCTKEPMGLRFDGEEFRVMRVRISARRLADNVDLDDTIETPATR